jgi:hypothetical protein
VTKVRYAERAAISLRLVRRSSEDAFHLLRGLILQLAVNPEIDNVRKFLIDFGSGQATPVYMDEDWWIVYQVTLVDNEEVFLVISIWNAAAPPQTRL